MTKTPTLSILIVNYNAASFLEVCLASIEKHLSLVENEVCVIDNASTDKSLETLQKFPSVKIIANAKNAGFAAGI